MAAGDVKIGRLGMEIALTATGRQLEEYDIEIAREERMASGKLRTDIIARKKAFRVHYDLLQGPDLEAVAALCDLRENLSLILVDRNGSERSYTVKFRPFGRRRESVQGDWIWRNVVLSFEEI